MPVVSPSTLKAVLQDRESVAYAIADVLDGLQDPHASARNYMRSQLMIHLHLDLLVHVRLACHAEAHQLCADIHRLPENGAGTHVEYSTVGRNRHRQGFGKKGGDYYNVGGFVLVFEAEFSKRAKPRKSRASSPASYGFIRLTAARCSVRS